MTRNTKTTGTFTYCRGTDGCDETWDIYDPAGQHRVSIHFWERAAGAEAEAQRIVHRLNCHGELLSALSDLLTVFDDKVADGKERRDPRIPHARQVHSRVAAGTDTIDRKLIRESRP